VAFWRTYYGAPALSNEKLVREHLAAKQIWGLENTRARPSSSEYARRVGALTAETARAYAKWLDGKKRVLDAERVRAAFDESRVLVLPAAAGLDGALDPLHAVPGAPPDLRDNRRYIAVTRLGDRALRALLAPEIAHAIFPPVWQRENHPPAFADAESELRAILGIHP
jgi:hypothetical protein